ncbi:MAG: cytochrome P450 [Chloroflexota bacterium]
MASLSEVRKTPDRVSGLPLVGNLPEFARDPIKFITRLKEDGGDVVGFSLLGDQSVLISHPKDIERVLLETGKRYSNGKSGTGYALKTIVGNGLVMSEGELWKRQRKLLAPAFHHQAIRKYAGLIVDYAHDLAQSWHDGAVRDIHQDMMTLTQRIIMKALFNVDVLNHAGTASEAFDTMMHAIDAEMRGLEAILPDFVPTFSRVRLREAVAYIDGLLTEIIEKQRSEAGDEHDDLLTMMMDARDDDGQPMSREQLLDEIRTLYLAGHETTATTLSWTWVLLSRNPEVYARLEAEIGQVLNGRTPTAEDVGQLSYCNAVIKEALRCYPVAWITRRVALEDVEIGGYQIAKGTSIYLSPWIVHHDARWYADPDTFMPERWLKDKSELPPREAYIPFGGGPRICIGNGLAMMEAVLILATLLQRYRVSVLAEHEVEIELTGTLRPKAGVQARMMERAL